MYLKKPYLLSLTCLARFNSRWALAFLVASLHALTTFLYSSQVACPSFHIPWTFLFHLSSARSSLLIHVGLLPPFLDFFSTTDKRVLQRKKQLIHPASTVAVIFSLHTDLLIRPSSLSQCNRSSSVLLQTRLFVAYMHSGEKDLCPV